MVGPHPLAPLLCNMKKKSFFWHGREGGRVFWPKKITTPPPSYCTTSGCVPHTVHIAIIDWPSPLLELFFEIGVQSPLHLLISFIFPPPCQCKSSYLLFESHTSQILTLAP